jgi:hypothetical protein
MDLLAKEAFNYNVQERPATIWQMTVKDAPAESFIGSILLLVDIEDQE